MKVLICGDRNWKDENIIQKVLKTLPSDSIIVHGGARGADSIAGKIAKSCGFKVCVYPAKWLKYGRAAGYLRNIEMLDKENPDIVFAFHDNIEQSKGTKHMMKQAEKRNIKVKLFKRM